jgi:hypothetical protein
LIFNFKNKLKFFGLKNTRIAHITTTLQTEMNIEEIKKRLTFDLWNYEFEDPELMFELEGHGEEYAKNENPEVYYGWKQLQEHIPRAEALEWLEDICSQIYNGQIKYEFKPKYESAPEEDVSHLILYQRVDV